MWFIWDTGVIFMFFNALSIHWFGIEVHTLDNFFFFAVLMSLRICIMCLFTEIV